MSDKNRAEEIREISGVDPYKCMKCGKCSASCPSFNEMDIKPHQFVSYVLRDDIESLVQSKSLWKCLSCFACVERCPRDVKPGKLIDDDNIRILGIFIIACNDGNRIAEAGTLDDVHNLSFHLFLVDVDEDDLGSEVVV